jgi:hypothetical protein
LPLAAGPSALLICAYLSGSTLTATDGTEAPSHYFTNYEQMDWNIPLVFSVFDTTGLGGATALEVKAGGSSTTFTTTSYANFVTNIAQNSAA